MSNTQTTTTATPKYSNVGAGAIKFLRSPLATLIVLCSALLAQLPEHVRTNGVGSTGAMSPIASLLGPVS